MNKSELIDLITKIAKSEGIDPNLAIAIAGNESNYDENACRYEPLWRYFVNPSGYAKSLNISIATEKVLQACSWSVMQVMGSVCRELGFTGSILTLIHPELGILFGCKKLKSLMKRFGSETDVISAYNQGVPLKENGVYKNQQYVDNVLKRLSPLRNK